jgi:hypothetical protein
VRARASACPASRSCTSRRFTFDAAKYDADFVVALPDHATGTHRSAGVKAHLDSRRRNRRSGNAETGTFGGQIEDGAVNCACRVRLEDQNISSNASACNLSSFDHLNLRAQVATLGCRRISFIKMLEGFRGLEQVNIKPTTAASYFSRHSTFQLRTISLLRILLRAPVTTQIVLFNPLC